MGYEIFQTWLDAWDLIPDGEPFSSNWSQLLPVRRGETLLMLKAAMSEQEVAGSIALEWFDGEGAARVVARRDDALLMERLFAPTGLADLAQTQGDRAAFEILCQVAHKLHSAANRLPFAGLVPVERWFEALGRAAESSGGFFTKAAAIFDALLASQGPRVPLHGDLHHGNAMQRPSGEWVAIDPKGLLGERTLDYAMMPFVDPQSETGIGDCEGIASRASVVAEFAGVEEERLLSWSFCQAALYGAWFTGHPIEGLWRGLAGGLADLVPDVGALSRSS
jgi:streptomycin 6-kinase